MISEEYSSIFLACTYHQMHKTPPLTPIFPKSSVFPSSRGISVLNELNICVKTSNVIYMASHFTIYNGMYISTLLYKISYLIYKTSYILYKISYIGYKLS